MELSQDKTIAFEKIKRDLKVIFRNAERVGKSFEDYLIDLKYDQDTISYFTHKISSLSDKEKEALGILIKPQPAPEPKEEQLKADPRVPQSRIALLLAKTKSAEQFLKFLCLIVFIAGVFFIVYFFRDWSERDRYQITAAHDGVYRLDKRTGEVEFLVLDPREKDVVSIREYSARRR